jgi:alginate O-acetyltransferase complex protein AlgI
VSVCSIEWVVCLLLLSAVFFLIPGVRSRQVFLFACNFAFVASMVPNAGGWIALASFTALGYGAARVLKRWPRKFILVLYLVAGLGTFIICKQYVLAKFLLPAALFRKIIATVGWSYILFRQIQVAVDVYQQQIDRVALWDYLNFQLNVFGFVAGPIQRFQEFNDYWNHLRPQLTDAESVLRAYLRIFVGAIKMGLLGGFFLACFTDCSVLLRDPERLPHLTRFHRILLLLGAFYTYPVYIYFNFAGYCDMVIGGGSLFGIKMPENFDRPYLSRNMIEYWTRWHRTLGFWIRDYIFTPLYKGIVGRWPQKAASLAFLCYFVAFFLAGVWHGSTWNFVIFGILNGLGSSVTKLWETFLLRRLGRQGLKSYLQNPRFRMAAIFTTVNFACLTIYFFRPELSVSYYMVRNAFASHL